MSERFEFLSRERFPAIYNAFMEAFSDYALDMSSLTERVLLNRCIKNGVDFESSVGVFDGDRMAGFTLVGLGDWRGSPAAFDAGTGVVPDYRGRGIAGAMLDYARPYLRENGIRRFLLEVLQQNEAAIKAYRSAGFSITRELDCFERSLDRFQNFKQDEGAITIAPADRVLLREFERHMEWTPSWENSIASIMRIPDGVVMLSARFGGRLAGALVYYPSLNWIMSLVVKREFRRKGIAARLLAELDHRIRAHRTIVRLINVDHSDDAMLAFVAHAGFEPYARQYEMELPLD